MNILDFAPLLAAWDWGYLLAAILGVIILAALIPLFLSRRPLQACPEREKHHR